MSIVFLFPGQGSQYSGMLQELPKHRRVTSVLDEATSLLGTDIFRFDNEESLKSTRAVQLSIFISSVAVGRALIEDGAKPSMVAGHSVGAFAAAVTAGVIPFEDALHLVNLRGQLMEAAYPDGYGMGVVLGLTKQQVKSIIEQVTTKETPVYLANINSPTQITISGTKRGIESVLALAQSSGARKVQMLQVNVPSHCPLLEDVSVKLDVALRNIEISSPTVPYIANCNARPLRDGEAIRNDLALSVANSVQWHEATRVCYELGGRLFLEMPPGQVLTDLASQAFLDARAISVTTSGLDSALLLAQREQENE
ncbi:malonate decarboxylase subunit epsilon [Bacillus sp. FJAT-45350]|uniref:malonate decarboxylase subunit epsilon n=1 Tax=Bacillus sp. FJAT-45350 TaxID=2011014 RepID=UPI000BB8582B|nr:malonate decarboxylase subunit epsilon [Bacillus sp. FJAT-45350]